MLPSNSNVEDVKTKLSCEAFLQMSKLEDVKHVFDAAVPMQKVFLHMQNTIAQHHQRKEKITLNHQFHCARISRHARRRPHPSRTRAYFSPHPKLRLPEKNTMFRANPNIQMTSMMYKNEAFVRCFRQIRRLKM